ncbi:diguanylate cyclase [Devosia chinhatensis]|uniref:diguanylate cyclase n=1 Tax=Devosia chinhatensis TaxID=429727 RepID=UPI000698E152|nr:diguanylate cyclase [Devosia chinhatensis]
MLKLFKARSLRFWVALGMIVALTPLTLSAILGQLVLNRGVIEAFHDVAERQRREFGPLQDLRILVWDTLIPIDEYINEGGAQRPLYYRELRSRIETGFADVRAQFSDDPEALQHLDSAFQSWQVADTHATELASELLIPDDPAAERQARLFHSYIQSASDRLGQAYDSIAIKIESAHDDAVAWSNSAGLLFGGAMASSFIAMVAGVAIVGLIMSRSVDRLVDGAARFADGDRNHRINISVPPELSRVAQEFNRMISRIEVSETALADLARIDELTQLYNRRAFEEALIRVHAGFTRGAGAGALITLDIDHFKSINDTYGHAAGDAVLRAFAEIVRKSIRVADQLYRTGGEEFAIILAQTSAETAVELAERIRAAVAAQPIIYREQTIRITVSVGIARFVENLGAAETVAAADAALYSAKAGGRNRVVLSEPTGP